MYDLQFTHPDQVTEKAPSGCYVSGLYLEGARWNLEQVCLQRPNPKVLVEELPILRVIPIEAHRLKLVVSIFNPPLQDPASCLLATYMRM